MRSDRKVLLLTIASSIVLLSVQLVWPLSFDNEIFQSMASELHRFHRLPFIGTWAHDLPGAVYMHWVSIIVFGDSTLGFRLFDFVLHITMSVLFIAILRH